MSKIPPFTARAASLTLTGSLAAVVGSTAGDVADATSGAIKLGSLQYARLVCQYARHASSTTGAPVFAVDVSMDSPDTAAATLFIDAAPTVSAPSTVANSYAILVLSGTTYLGGDVTTGGNLSFDSASPTITATAANQGITLTPNGSGAVSLQGSGAANIVAVDTTGGVSRLGFYNAGPVARAAAVSARNAAGVGYVQADAATWVTAINEIVTALQNIGITL